MNTAFVLKTAQAETPASMQALLTDMLGKQAGIDVKALAGKVLDTVKNNGENIVAASLPVISTGVGALMGGRKGAVIGGGVGLAGVAGMKYKVGLEVLHKLTNALKGKWNRARARGPQAPSADDAAFAFYGDHPKGYSPDVPSADDAAFAFESDDPASMPFHQLMGSAIGLNDKVRKDNRVRSKIDFSKQLTPSESLGIDIDSDPRSGGAAY